MQALFVHGMGRSTVSGWRLLAHLRVQGIHTHAFGYAAAFQNFASIHKRLGARIHALPADGDYVLIGHSLGVSCCGQPLPRCPRKPGSQFGAFVSGIPAPLGIGKLELTDGSVVNGFICEGIGVADAQDITEYGEWLGWLAGRGK